MLHGTLRQTARLRGRSYATEPAARCHAPRPLHGSARKVFATRSQTSGLRHDRPTSRQRRRQESTTGTLACRSALTPESTTSKPAHDTATSTAWGLSPALACSNREPGLLAVPLVDRQECLSYFQTAAQAGKCDRHSCLSISAHARALDSQTYRDTATSTAWGLHPALACSNREPGLLAVPLVDRQECLSYFQTAAQAGKYDRHSCLSISAHARALDSQTYRDTATSTAWGLCPALACSNREPGLLAVALADGQESRGFANRSAAEIDEVKQAKPTHRTFRQRFASDHSLGFSGLIGPSAERTPFTWVLRLKTLSPLQA